MSDQKVNRPEGILDTPFGKLKYRLGKDAVAIFTKNDGADPTIRVNNVEYTVNLSLYFVDGDWKVKSYSDCYMRRYGRPAFEDTSPTLNALKKFSDTVLDLWKKKVTPKMVQQAELAHLDEEIEKDESFIAEKEKEIADRTAKMEERKARRREMVASERERFVTALVK